MADYIYLLENRLSADQQHALRQLRDAAREAEMILFLTGDAVRDLTSGHAVRDLEVAVHGNALKLKKTIEKLGGKIWGEDETSKSLYLCFPGTVRVDLVSTHRVEYPKPGKAVYHPAAIQEDLRRRDFTVNAMAISLNEGSFGLLMDPLNGAADIEARTLRLVSNYGFLEEPALLIRATRYKTRLGWDLDPRTQTRYENALGEGVIEHLSETARSGELEQIGHEEEGLKVLQALEDAGWMKVLFPAWTPAKADVEKLAALHDLAVELLVQGVHADVSAAQMQLLTAKLSSKDLAALKKMMLRPGFVEEWNSLDAQAAKFAKVLLSKENASASAGFKLFTTYDPEAILWLGFTSKDGAVKERFNLFLKVWPEARQRIPHALMQEMRITPELPTYKDIVHAIFLELIDERLTTPEEMRAFLEPHSPPAPPPQVTIKRPRAKRGVEPKVKERSFDDEDESEDELEADEDLDDIGGDDEDLDLGLPKGDLGHESAEESDSAEDDMDVEETEPVAVPVKRGAKAPAAPKGKKEAAAPVKAEDISVKPPPGVSEASVKPPITAKASSVKPPNTPAIATLSVKPPAQPAQAAAIAAKPPASAKNAVKAKTSSVKPPAPAFNAAAKSAPKPKATSVKPPAKPATNLVKPAAKKAKPAAKPVAKAKAKAPVKATAKVTAKKPAASKKKPAKVSKPVAKKPVPKPMKKKR